MSLLEAGLTFALKTDSQMLCIPNSLLAGWALVRVHRDPYGGREQEKMGADVRLDR